MLFQEAFNCMQLEEARIEEVAMTLFGFAGHIIYPVWQITLPLTLGDEPSQRTNMTPFLVVDAPSTYNIILGHSFLSTFMDVASPYYQKIKFPIGCLVGEVRGDQKVARGCYVEMVNEDQKRVRVQGKAVGAPAPAIFEVHVLEEMTPRISTLKEGELMEIADNKATWVTRQLEPDIKVDLIACLKRNTNILRGMSLT